eukprot:CAMPEP_0173304020 /NCGR_PEP_ID=MMETSP1143-20121109/19210_1 /TAXON_ID=483371 /ORGANISM="non described non described, Strain CCMP2298" /LENGTH=281 /DNA_ID=CAMNT_0014244789 /DNA_START=144 /DNA_END=985 /DNA_ORIENTATION=-
MHALLYAYLCLLLLPHTLPLSASPYPPSTSTLSPLRPTHTYPHDARCFTQGLVLTQNTLYESCGFYGKSSLRIVDLKTGSVIKETKIEAKYFAEGIAVVGGVVYMLTWKERQVLLFDAQSLKQIGSKQFESYSGQGWGLTTDGEKLIASDGSDRITFYQIPVQGDGSSALQKIRTMTVRDPHTKKPVRYLNELEYAGGYIYANVWYKDYILKIDPETGLVLRKLDLSHLYPHPRSRTADCLNGIAYNRTDGSFILTGKMWPSCYVVRLDDSIADKGAESVV